MRSPIRWWSSRTSAPPRTSLHISATQRGRGHRHPEPAAAEERLQRRPDLRAGARPSDTLAGAEGVRVVFLRGAGGTFTAGADLDWMRAAVDRTEADNRADAFEMAKMLKAAARPAGAHRGPRRGRGLRRRRRPGGGLRPGGGHGGREVQLLGGASLGLIAATISPYVVEAIGPRMARALFATGRIFDADYAAAHRPGHRGRADDRPRLARPPRAHRGRHGLACAPGAVAARQDASSPTSTAT